MMWEMVLSVILLQGQLHQVILLLHSVWSYVTIIPKDSLATQCDIVGLQEGVQYQVKMLAFNDVGDGLLSHIITRTTTSGNFIATFCVVLCNHYS